jgi:hypothetical protein
MLALPLPRCRSLHSVLPVRLGNATITVEFDLKTQTSFSGITNGGRVDTVYSIDFSSAVGTQQTVQVSKLQNARLQQFQLSGPDSSIGDTTTLGGRFYKLGFPSVLPDLSHTGLSGLSASASRSDGQTDALYSFYLSTDSTLVTRPTALAPTKVFTLGADRTPLVGSGSVHARSTARLFGKITHLFSARQQETVQTASSRSRRQRTIPSTTCMSLQTRPRTGSPPQISSLVAERSSVSTIRSWGHFRVKPFWREAVPGLLDSITVTLLFSQKARS